MKNARRHILIQPDFQLRFAFLLTLTVVVIGAIFPIFFISMFDLANAHAAITNNPAIQQALSTAKKDFILLTLAVQVLMVVGCFVLAIYHSHKIVGPLYKLRISMVALRQGLLDRHITFRKGDNFVELANEFNLMSDAILTRRRKDFEAIQSVLPKLDRVHEALKGEEKASLGEALNVLREMSEEKKSR